MPVPYTLVALHGFASSPGSRKNLHFDEHFRKRGLRLLRPDLNQPSFGQLSFRAMLDEVERAWASAGGAPLRMIGSSLGGYVAALFASLHPERVERLVLLCPAFDLAGRWADLVSEERMAEWRTRGALAFEDATGHPVDLHLAFLDEARALPPSPRVTCPTVLIHGRADARVPFAQSERYAASTPAVLELVAVDDGHDLLASLPVIDSVLDRFLLDPGSPPR